MQAVLSIRVDAENENHHLWNNHGTWWCHYTVHPTEWTKKRVRISLHTRDVHEARARRDEHLAGLLETPPPFQTSRATRRATQPGKQFS